MRGLLRLYFPPLPRSVATLQVGGLVNSFGNGMVIPFMFIYLHNVRGIGLGVVGLILAAHALASLVSGPVFGSQIDRLGGKVMLALSLLILAIGYAGYALVHEPWQGFLVAVVSGIGVGGFWPSQSTLIAGLTPAEQRPAAFAMQRVVMSVGIGLGALAGGVIAATDSPETFTVLFLLDAATFLVYGAVMLATVPSPSTGTGARDAGASGSYRQVLRHTAFVAVIGLNALFIFAGFSGFDVLPVYAKNQAGLTELQIGLLFFVNTVVIVVAQLPIARLARGRRRMRTLALLGLSGRQAGSSCRLQGLVPRPPCGSWFSSWSPSRSGSACTAQWPRPWSQISPSPAFSAATWRSTRSRGRSVSHSDPRSADSGSRHHRRVCGSRRRPSACSARFPRSSSSAAFPSVPGERLVRSRVGLGLSGEAPGLESRTWR